MRNAEISTKEEEVAADLRTEAAAMAGEHVATCSSVAL